MAGRPGLVVAGYGMVAHRLVRALSDRGYPGRITVLAEENRPAYDRVNLTTWFDGGADALALPPVEGTVHLGDPVVTIDRHRKVVRTRGGRTVGYDTLVLATGSRPFVPPIEGRDARGSFVYRTIDDLEAIRDRAVGARRGVVVGGGLLGLEAANALQRLGLATSVVEIADRLMPMQVDDGGGRLLRRHVEGLGVRVHTGRPVARIEAEGTVSGLTFVDGTRIEAEIVVFAAGVRPRDELARGCGLPVGRRGGIVVDDQCRTGDPDIYAVGECAEVDGQVHALVAPGYAMADVVADWLTGGAAAFATADTSTKLKLLGVDVASFGDAFAVTPGALDLVYADPVAGVYGKLVVTDDAQRLLGGILVGDASAYPMLRALANGGEPLPERPAELILPARNDDAPRELSAAATVCSCQNVSTAALCNAIRDEGCTTLPELKAATGAGTACGSCLPLVKHVLTAELAKTGVAVSRALCEHFEQSRVELFDIVRVRGIATFSQLIAEHGRGRGCDICKPAVASMLASLGGGHVLDGEQAALQDTNDHVLANLQRNGSYSVVPRIPGGEITPGKLIVLGEVAQEFGLYTKITGGQRIDLLGARLEQLPAIWRRLVDAGFESGHAYGKALRTVKSCVGSTWCRFGVQDSVGLAIALELRYRGLRAPHKIKAGVSGCARECAEAQAKDFGVIGTDSGWNLYVGGNGGFKPRHAELFARDLDAGTLVRYIDRFLMFYVRTADRLQRTASWIDAMDGGLDHLRRVVVDDELGLAAELDAAMQRHVDSYSDEWRAVLEDPDKLRRYVSFVNAPGTPDPSITFVDERGQLRPTRTLEVVRG